MESVKAWALVDTKTGRMWRDEVGPGIFESREQARQFRREQMLADVRVVKLVASSN